MSGAQMSLYTLFICTIVQIEVRRRFIVRDTACGSRSVLIVTQLDKMGEHGEKDAES